MRATHAAFLLLLGPAGCATGTPEAPVSKPPTVAAQPRTPRPAAKPAAPKSQPAAGKVAAPVAKTPTAPALDLNTLVAQLKETDAIGFFTKITLKNQIDDLLDQFREHYQGRAKLTMTDLRRSFDLLIMKVLSLLQDEDQGLASAIVASRESIWRLLANPKTFATIQG
jgi:hypothetical protein